ncbi:MAG: transposase family protein [Williamsia sp.]|nr:transposase family protein [Williamsia sp.]
MVLQAIETHGKPEIINSDQGSQFTSELYVEALKSQGIQISMDGKGRAIDNIFIERLFLFITMKGVISRSIMKHP